MGASASAVAAAPRPEEKQQRRGGRNSDQEPLSGLSASSSAPALPAARPASASKRRASQQNGGDSFGVSERETRPWNMEYLYAAKPPEVQQQLLQQQQELAQQQKQQEPGKRAKQKQKQEDAGPWTCAICGQKGNEADECTTCRRPRGKTLARSYCTVAELTASVVDAINDGRRGASVPAQSRAESFAGQDPRYKFKPGEKTRYQFVEDHAPPARKTQAASTVSTAFEGTLLPDVGLETTLRPGAGFETTLREHSPPRDNERGPADSAAFKPAHTNGGMRRNLSMPDVKRVTWHDDPHFEGRGSRQPQHDTGGGMAAFMATDSFGRNRSGARAGFGGAQGVAGMSKTAPPVPAVPMSLGPEEQAVPRFHGASPARIGDRLAGPADGAPGPPLPASRTSVAAARATQVAQLAKQAEVGQENKNSRVPAELPHPPPLPPRNPSPPGLQQPVPAASQLARESMNSTLPRMPGAGRQDARQPAPVQTQTGFSPSVPRGPARSHTSSGGLGDAERTAKRLPSPAPVRTGVRNATRPGEAGEVDVLAMLQGQLAHLERAKNRIGNGL